ncbi:hypothetical protein AB0K16_51025 [Nonomuraea jabiensis]|uniref:hypothetical protein n=1 Tax=Nonomuraea jabiensis TaxID=882448 RepID=UPI003415270D
MPHALRSARKATYTLLFVNGLATTSWVIHLPDIAQQTRSSDAQIGLATSGVGIGSVVFIVLMGFLLSRYGTRAAAALAVAFYGLAMPMLGFATGFPVFFLALLLGGAGSAAVEIAASTSGSRLEHAYGKPMMPSFIGSMGLGMVVGTLVGAGSLALGLSTLTHMSSIGVVILAAGVYACPRLLAGKADKTVGATVRHLPRPSWRLAAISAVILVSVIEGATLTWATLYMTRDLGTTAAFAAFAVTAHSLGTTAVQLSGDWFRRRYSAAHITRVSVVVGGAVMAGALAVGNPWLALVGFFALGGGIAFVYPAGISAAADTQATPAPGVAVAQTVRYLAGFGAGPLLGVLVGAYGLTWTFALTIAFGVTLTLLLGGFLGKEPGLGRRSGGDLPTIETAEADVRPAAGTVSDLAVQTKLD